MSAKPVKRDCQCKVAQHSHGTRVAYVVDRCRCTECREAATAYERNRRRQTAYGRFDTGRVDAAPVRDHIRYLMENGVSYKQVSKLSGVSLSAVGAILYGRGERGHDPYPRVHRGTAEKILAVKPSLGVMAEGRCIDATGTRRRLQALVAIGWSQSRLGAAIGITPGNFHRTMRSHQVTVATAKAVRELYEREWNNPQTGDDWHSKTAATRARKHAKAQGWVPPLAWDDDTIDDPATVPAAMVESGILHGEERVEEIEFLIRTGAGQAEVITRAGFRNLPALERFCIRHGRNDLVYRVKRLREMEAVA